MAGRSRHVSRPVRATAHVGPGGFAAWRQNRKKAPVGAPFVLAKGVDWVGSQLVFQRQRGRNHVDAKCLAHRIVSQLSCVHVQTVEQMRVVLAGLFPAFVGEV